MAPMPHVAPHLGVARAPFPFTLIAAGASAAAWDGAFAWTPTLWSLAGLILLHAFTDPDAVAERRHSTRMRVGFGRRRAADYDRGEA